MEVVSMEEQEKEWTHKEWAMICPECGDRRMLWPINQNISSLEDPKATFVHSNGLDGCS
jgi:hypothetical protein